MWIITELMVNGSLQDYLHKKGNSLIRDGNMTVLITMAGQCASGMAYLEAEVWLILLLFLCFLCTSSLYRYYRMFGSNFILFI